MSLSNGDIALNELEKLMSTERYKDTINALLKWTSDSLDDKQDLTKLDIEKFIDLYKVNPSTKTVEQCAGYNGKIYKFYEQLAIEQEGHNQVLDNYIINREAEIKLLKLLKILGDQMGKLKSDFLCFFTKEKSEDDPSEVPYVIDFEIAIGEDEERKKEELKNNFLKNIKPVFGLYINRKVDENPNFDVNDEVIGFSLLLGKALNNEMVYGKDLSAFNTDSKVKTYINEIEIDQLSKLIYEDLVQPVDTIIIAKQCFNVLSERYNKEENFNELNNNDNTVRNSDIDCHAEKLKNLNETLSELKNIILKKYGDYSLSDYRENLYISEKAFSIKVLTSPNCPGYREDLYYNVINKKYLENGGIDTQK